MVCVNSTCAAFSQGTAGLAFTGLVTQLLTSVCLVNDEYPLDYSYGLASEYSMFVYI